MKNINKKWFTMAEMLIVIAILSILAIISFSAFDSNSTKDKVRVKAQSEVVQLLERFRGDYWVYPNSLWNSRDYPSWCNVSWYKTLMSCFVTVWYLVEWEENYDNIAFDPVDGQMNDENNVYQYYYWTNSNWNKFKTCYLPYNQKWFSDKDKVGLDWWVASEWSIYICSTSTKTLNTDVTTLSN